MGGVGVLLLLTPLLQCPSQPATRPIGSPPQDSLFLGCPAASRGSTRSYSLSEHEALATCLLWSEDAQPAACRRALVLHATTKA